MSSLQSFSVFSWDHVTCWRNLTHLVWGKSLSVSDNLRLEAFAEQSAGGAWGALCVANAPPGSSLQCSSPMKGCLPSGHGLDLLPSRPGGLLGRRLLEVGLENISLSSSIHLASFQSLSWLHRLCRLSGPSLLPSLQCVQSRVWCAPLFPLPALCPSCISSPVCSDLPTQQLR